MADADGPSSSKDEGGRRLLKENTDEFQREQVAHEDAPRTAPPPRKRVVANKDGRSGANAPADPIERMQVMHLLDKADAERTERRQGVKRRNQQMNLTYARIAELVGRCPNWVAKMKHERDRQMCTRVQGNDGNVRTVDVPVAGRQGGFRWCRMNEEQKRMCTRIAIENPRLSVAQIRERMLDVYPDISLSESTVWRALHASNLQVLRAKMKDPRAQATAAHEAELDSFLAEQKKGMAGELGVLDLFMMDESTVELNLTPQRAWGTSENPAVIRHSKGKTMTIGVYAGIGLVSDTFDDATWTKMGEDAANDKTVNLEEWTNPSSTQPRGNDYVYRDGMWTRSEHAPRFAIFWWLRPPTRDETVLPRFIDDRDMVGFEPVVLSEDYDKEEDLNDLIEQGEMTPKERIERFLEQDSYYEKIEKDDHLAAILWLNGIEWRQTDEDGNLVSVTSKNKKPHKVYKTRQTMLRHLQDLTTRVAVNHLERLKEEKRKATQPSDTPVADNPEHKKLAERPLQKIPRTYYDEFGRNKLGGVMKSERGDQTLFLKYLQLRTNYLKKAFPHSVFRNWRDAWDSAPQHGKTDVTKNTKSFIHDWVVKKLGTKGAIFLPVREPDFNPVELLFSFIKGVIRRRFPPTRAQIEVDEMIHLIDEAFGEVTEDMVKGWFRYGCYPIPGESIESIRKNPRCGYENIVVGIEDLWLQLLNIWEETNERLPAYVRGKMLERDPDAIHEVAARFLTLGNAFNQGNQDGKKPLIAYNQKGATPKYIKAQGSVPSIPIEYLNTYVAIEAAQKLRGKEQDVSIRFLDGIIVSTTIQSGGGVAGKMKMSVESIGDDSVTLKNGSDEITVKNPRVSVKKLHDSVIPLDHEVSIKYPDGTLENHGDNFKMPYHRELLKLHRLLIDDASGVGIFLEYFNKVSLPEAVMSSIEELRVIHEEREGLMLSLALASTCAKKVVEWLRSKMMPSRQISDVDILLDAQERVFHPKLDIARDFKMETNTKNQQVCLTPIMYRHYLIRSTPIKFSVPYIKEPKYDGPVKVRSITSKNVTFSNDFSAGNGRLCDAVKLDDNMESYHKIGDELRELLRPTPYGSQVSDDLGPMMMTLGRATVAVKAYAAERERFQILGKTITKQVIDSLRRHGSAAVGGFSVDVHRIVDDAVLRWRRRCGPNDNCVTIDGAHVDDVDASNMESKNLAPVFVIAHLRAERRAAIQLKTLARGDPDERRWPGYPLSERYERNGKPIRTVDARRSIGTDNIDLVKEIKITNILSHKNKQYIKGTVEFEDSADREEEELIPRASKSGNWPKYKEDPSTRLGIKLLKKNETTLLRVEEKIDTVSLQEENEENWYDLNIAGYDERYADLFKGLSEQNTIRMQHAIQRFKEKVAFEAKKTDAFEAKKKDAIVGVYMNMPIKYDGSSISQMNDKLVLFDPIRQTMHPAFHKSVEDYKNKEDTAILGLLDTSIFEGRMHDKNTVLSGVKPTEMDKWTEKTAHHIFQKTGDDEIVVPSVQQLKAPRKLLLKDIRVVPYNLTYQLYGCRIYLLSGSKNVYRLPLKKNIKNNYFGKTPPIKRMLIEDAVQQPVKIAFFKGDSQRMIVYTDDYLLIPREVVRRVYKKESLLDIARRCSLMSADAEYTSLTEAESLILSLAILNRSMVRLDDETVRFN